MRTLSSACKNGVKSRAMEARPAHQSILAVCGRICDPPERAAFGTPKYNIGAPSVGDRTIPFFSSPLGKAGALEEASIPRGALYLRRGLMKWPVASKFRSAGTWSRFFTADF